MGRYGQTIILG